MGEDEVQSVGGMSAGAVGVKFTLIGVLLGVPAWMKLLKDERLD